MEQLIAQRRSARRFTREPILRIELRVLMRAAMEQISGDAFGHEVIQPFLIVNAVEQVPSGAYAWPLRELERGDFRRVSAELALGQSIAGQAAVNIYFMTDLDAVLLRFGDRGYRVAQMAAAIAGGRLELEATALGLGATGLTFFDDEVTNFFEPAAHGRQVMYLVAAGHPF